MAREFDTLIDQELRRRDTRGLSPYDQVASSGQKYKDLPFNERFGGPYPYQRDPEEIKRKFQEQLLIDRIQHDRETPGQTPGQMIEPGYQERFKDETKVISSLGGQQFAQASTGTATDALPPGFSYREPQPQAPQSDLPPGFSYRGAPPATPAPNVPAPNASESRFAGPEPAPVAAPNAGVSQLPEDPAERAAITLKRSASGSREEGAATRAIESVVPAIGSEVERLGGIAEKALKTGDIAPKDALETGMLLNPASVAYRTGMGVARAALTPAQQAARELGVTVPAAADAGPTRQAIARGMSAVPVGGASIRKSAEQATSQLEEAGAAAATRPTGEVVARQEAGQSTREALKSTLDEMQATTGGKAKFPPRVRALLKGTDEDIVGKITTMAGRDNRGADIKTLSLVRSGHSPEEWAPMQSALIDQFGRSKATGTFDPATWVRSYSNLSDRGKDVLFGQGSDALRRHLDAIESVSRRAPSWQQFEKGRATLGTKVGVASLVGTAVGAGMAPLKLLATVIPMSILSRSLSKASTAAPVAQFSKAYERVVRTQGGPQSIAALTIAVRNMNNTLDTNVSVDDVLKGGASGQPVE